MYVKNICFIKTAAFSGLFVYKFVYLLSAQLTYIPKVGLHAVCNLVCSLKQ